MSVLVTSQLPIQITKMYYFFTCTCAPPLWK